MVLGDEIMAVELTLNYENAKNMLFQSISNDARPIAIIDAQTNERALLIHELFSEDSCTLYIHYDVFISGYIYDISGRNKLLNYSYIIIDNVKNPGNMTATMKILSSFISSMAINNISVIFMGEHATENMRGILHMSGSKIQYIIKIQHERK